MMLHALDWLSYVFGVPLPLTGGYIARAIEELDIENFDRHMLLFPWLPTIMDTVSSILPTWEVFILLKNIPRASEMGEPEDWVIW